MKIFANLPKYSLLTYAYIFLSFVCVAVVLNHNYQVHKAKEQAIAKQQEIVKQQIAKAQAVDAKQFKCLTDNIYYEAGNQGTLGQAAVGRVVLNRVKHGFGRNICDVVYDKTIRTKETENGTITRVICQFSWVCEDGPKAVNSTTYANAKLVAWKILTTDAYHDILPKNTLYFHNTKVNPNWGLQRVTKIGEHIFYSNTKVKDKKVNQDI
jgi:spore germination cell wall hydrolase CwlJ-like protein